MTLTPGTEIGGYRIDSLISQGGMGAVYRAVQLSVDRVVAFKTLLHDGNPKAVERFKQEAKIVARISHPNVVQVLDLREEGGVLFIAMELVEGVDLSTRLKEAGPLDEATAIDYMRQSAEALAAAHAKGVIHRDVKPSNIMLTAGNVVKVMDFGIAKSVVEETQITRAGALLGTPDYMPPEQISGEAADARSDIYALGATFYHLAAGRPPFVGKVYTDVLVAHKVETALPLTEVARGIGRGFSEFIAGCLAKEPARRPSSMEAVADALRRLLHAGAMAAEPAGPVQDLLQPDHVREMTLIEFLARSRRLGRHEVDKALAVQREHHARNQRKALEDILVEKKLLTREDLTKTERELQRLRMEQDNQVAMQIIRKNTLLDADKIAVLEKTTRKHEAPVLEFLEQKGWLAESALEKVRDLAGRHRLKAVTHALGQLLLEKKMITVDGLDKYLKDKDGPPLGQRLLEDRILGEDELKALLDVQKLKAVEHYFSLEVVTGEIRLRDRLQCPRCSAEVFHDDDICLNCKTPLHRKPATHAGLAAEEPVTELEVIDDDDTGTSLKEWFVRTKSGDKGPYSLNDLMRLAGAGKIGEKHLLRQGLNGSWKQGGKTPKVSRVLGLCHNCGNIRSKKPGTCDVCNVDD